MTRGGVGRGAARLEPALRGDRIAWLADEPRDAAEAAAFALFEALRITCNRKLMLGLFEFEGHYALYPPGARYARHRDRFRDDDARVLSCVLYLNDGWRRGRRRSAAPSTSTTAIRSMSRRWAAPSWRSCPTRSITRCCRRTRTRIALTGWFRRRALQRRFDKRNVLKFSMLCSKVCHAFLPSRRAVSIGLPLPCRMRRAA